MKKVSVVIGRWQPLHNEHQRMIEYAQSIADRTIVLIGSAYEPRSLKNPWTEIERCQMLRAVFSNTIWPGYLRDFPYDDEAWFYNAQSVIEAMTEEDEEVIIVGCNKDATTFYLDGFPQYKLNLFESRSPLNATDIRADLFAERGLHSVPSPVFDWIINWCEVNEAYGALQQKLVDVNKYQEQWGKGPFLCVDSILMSEGEWFAIITHREGTLALPGGFLDRGERTLAGARRECVEEIGYDPGPSPISFRIADKPDRDPRCHNVSIVYVWDVGDNMPTLTAGDDAIEVRWMDWHEIQTRREEFRADHFHLIEGAYFNA